MKAKPNTYFLGFLIILMTYVAVSAVTWERFEAKILPFLVSSLIIILCCIQLVKEFYAIKRQALIKADEPDRPRTKETLRKFGLMMGWLLGLLLSVYLVGFFVAIPLFTFTFLKVNKKGWFTSTIYAALVIAFVYGLFRVLLKLPFYEGLLFAL